LLALAAIRTANCEVYAIRVDGGLRPLDTLPELVNVEVGDAFRHLAARVALKLDRLTHPAIAPTEKTGEIAAGKKHPHASWIFADRDYKDGGLFSNPVGGRQSAVLLDRP
jgi:hypothetical protein